MYGKMTFALAGAFLSFAAAVPMDKRAVVWVTTTQEDVVTIPVTKTVWLEPGEETPAASPATSAVAHYGHGHKTRATSTVHSTVTVKPVPSSEESAAPFTYETPTSSASLYVASTTSSASEHVAPLPSSTSSTSVHVVPTTSSTPLYVAPTTSSTSEYVAPPATSTYVAPATTWSAAATPTSSSGSGSSPMSGKSYSGDLTYYGTGMGACGITSGYSDHIVAISEVIFDQYTLNGNPNNNPLCGQKVSITGSSGSKYEATIVDRCTGCAAADLDLSQGFFDLVEPAGDGRVHNVHWTFI